jgi:hypothetical protein
MITEHTKEYIVSLVHELRKLPRETEWFEFKLNLSDPEESASICPPWRILPHCWERFTLIWFGAWMTRIIP